MNQPSEPAALAPGTVVHGYVVEQALDHDGQGYRYRAQHAQHGVCLLHEFFPLDFACRGEDGQLASRDPDDRMALRWWVRSYLDRAHQCAAAQHPALLPILDSFEAQGTAWSVTPRPGGPQLQDLLDGGAPLEPARLLQLMSALLDAVEALHAVPTLHRALCPRQIWLPVRGQIQIGGFGSLRAPVRFKARLQHSVAIPPYAAPEEAQPDAVSGPAGDLYAIAAILYHATAARPPLPAELRRQGAAQPALHTLADGRLPAETCAAIDAALVLDAQARPPAVADWRKVLHAPAMPAAPVVGTVIPAPPRARRRPQLAAAAALVLGAGALLAWQMLSPEPPPSTVATLPAASQPASTAVNLPRYVPVSLASESGSPRLNPATLARLAEADLAAAAAITRSAAAPAPSPSPPAPPAETAATGPQPPASARAGDAAARREPARSEPARSSEPVRSDEPPVQPPPQTAPVELASAASATSPAPGANTASAPGEAQSPPPLEVAMAGTARPPPLDPEAAERAEAERRAREHAQQLALERSRCRTHVSELFAGRDFTYADIAGFNDVVKTADGRLQTPPLRTDDGRRLSFLIDANGCVLRVSR